MTVEQLMTKEALNLGGLFSKALGASDEVGAAARRLRGTSLFDGIAGSRASKAGPKLTPKIKPVAPPSASGRRRVQGGIGARKTTTGASSHTNTSKTGKPKAEESLEDILANGYDASGVTSRKWGTGTLDDAGLALARFGMTAKDRVRVLAALNGVGADSLRPLKDVGRLTTGLAGVPSRLPNSLLPDFLGNRNLTRLKTRNLGRELETLLLDQKRMAKAMVEGNKAVRGLSTGASLANMDKFDELAYQIAEAQKRLKWGHRKLTAQTHGKIPVAIGGGIGGYHLLKSPTDVPQVNYNPYGRNELG